MIIQRFHTILIFKSKVRLKLRCCSESLSHKKHVDRQLVRRIIIIITILPAPKRGFQQVITNHIFTTNNIYTHKYTYIQTQIKVL